MPKGIYKHKPLSKETKERISSSLKGHKTSEETKRKIGNANKGRNPSKNTIDMARKLKIGKSYEEIYGKEKAIEIRNKMSLSHKGKKLKKETKLKIGLSHKGRKLSEEHRLIAIKNLKPAWNKGLTKEIDERVKRNGLNTGKTLKEKWKDFTYRDEQLKSILNGMFKRPTSFEQKIILLCSKYRLPFVYTGDGRILIGYKNPDFINEKDKVIIEVFLDYFKIRDFGSVKNYIKKRSEYFTKYGYKTIFIREKEIMNENWENICLNKITNYINQKTLV